MNGLTVHIIEFDRTFIIEAYGVDLTDFSCSGLLVICVRVFC